MFSSYLFIEFETPEQASLAIKTYDNYPMDKTHYISVNRFTDVEKYSQVEQVYKEPEEEKFVEKVIMDFFLIHFLNIININVNRNL